MQLLFSGIPRKGSQTTVYVRQGLGTKEYIFFLDSTCLLRKIFCTKTYAGIFFHNYFPSPHPLRSPIVNVASGNWLTTEKVRQKL